MGTLGAALCKLKEREALCHLLGKPNSTNWWLSFRGPDHNSREPQLANVGATHIILDNGMGVLEFKFEQNKERVDTCSTLFSYRLISYFR